MTKSHSDDRNMTPDTAPTMRERLIEAAARAIVRYEMGSLHPAIGADDDVPVMKTDRALATAALDAVLDGLSEPTPEMVEAGTLPSRAGPASVLRAMLATLHTDGIGG
jgi:hypothetical protein